MFEFFQFVEDAIRSGSVDSKALNEIPLNHHLCAVDMILKKKGLSPPTYSDAVKSAKNRLDVLGGRLEDSSAIFLVGIVKKSIKRLDFLNEDTSRLLKLLSDFNLFQNGGHHYRDELLRLYLVIGNYDFDASDSLILDKSFEIYMKPLELFLGGGGEEEFYFIKTAHFEAILQQRIQRHLVLIDPKRSLDTLDMSNWYWFSLMSASDSELFRFLLKLCQQDSQKFGEFYSWVICEAAVLVFNLEFFISQLASDPMDCLKLLLEVSRLSAASFPSRHLADIKTFHHSLAILISEGEFPFSSRILVRKLKNFADSLQVTKEAS